MKILDEELEFDFLDGDEIAKLENAVFSAKNDIDKLDDKQKTSQLVIKTCERIGKCFDDIFGEGTSSRIFKGKHNIKMCLRAFKELIDEKERQEKELNDEMKDLSKYLPNRKTRRGK